MASYFRQVPNFAYVSRDQDNQGISNYSVVKNFFKRGKLRDDIFGNLSYFTKYQIIGDERPDNVAYKFYEDSTLDWIILLSNNIINIQTEWPLPQRSFDKFLLEKYRTTEYAIKYFNSIGANINALEIPTYIDDDFVYQILYSGIHHYETVEIRNSLGGIVLPSGLKMTNNTWRTEGNFIQVINTKINQIFAGSGGNASKTATVTMNSGIKGLTVGSQVLINNVSENIFNGRFVVTSVFAPFDDIANSFTYELPSVPSNLTPTISTSKKEEVVFIVKDNLSDGNSYYYEYYDEGLGYYETLPASKILTPVTNYEYESRIENDKRNIFVLKPRYLNIVFNDMSDLMPYKKGAVQYINNTLKRADNIRLYE